MTHPTHDVDSDGQASADEIEVTPEMIESGMWTLYGFHIQEPDDEEMRKAVCAVFRAMIEARATGRIVGLPAWVQESG